jgi:hypothetical protein
MKSLLHCNVLDPMRGWFRGLAAALAAAAATASSAVAQSVIEPTLPPGDRRSATASGSGALTLQDLRVCVELEDGVAKRSAAHDVQVAEHNEAAKATEAEARSIEQAQAAQQSPDMAGEAMLSRRIAAYNARVVDLKSKADRLKAEEVQLGEGVNRYNMTCANRNYSQRDKQQALTEYRERKAAADAAEPFDAGLKAFDKGQHQEAFRLWLPLAEAGRVSAQFNVAVMYEQGLGMAKNGVEAARWYGAAAERGDVSSQLKMGSLFQDGVGVAKDLGSASYWYGEAARGGAKDADAARQARERLAELPKEYQAGAEDVVAFDGGRFVLRRAANRQCVIALQGTVTQAADFKFNEVLKRAKAVECVRPLTLVLESPGGLHDAGLALARSIRGEGMHTMARYECASSCATIFLGGSERVLWGARAAIGFHQLSRVRGHETAEDGTCVKSRDDPGVIALRRYLRFVVPDTAEEVFRIVMNTSCKSIDWVKGKRALDLQVATRVEAEGEDVFGPIEQRESRSSAVSR